MSRKSSSFSDGPRMQLWPTPRTRQWLLAHAQEQDGAVADLAREFIDDRLYLFGLPPRYYARIQAEAEKRRLSLTSFLQDHLTEAAASFKDPQPGKAAAAASSPHLMPPDAAPPAPLTQADRLQVRVSVRTGGWLQRIAAQERARLADIAVRYMEDRIYLFGVPPRIYARIQAEADRQHLPLRALVLDMLATLGEGLPEATPGPEVPMGLLPSAAPPRDRR